MNTKHNNSFKILLVDDDPITNYISKIQLKNLGFENIDAVENGKQAIAYVKNECPNLIFLDINMPIMDGFEFLEWRKANNLCPSTAIIVLTSSGRPSDQKRAIEFQGVIEYLEKPLNYDKIHQTLLKLRAEASNF